jgi:capsular polysaccharide biosynthesis protein
MINPIDLLQAIQREFSEPVSMHDFGSMYDTMRILGSTRLLISPHGAGLSNIVFMRIGTTVLETDSFLCDFQGNFYGELARSVSVNHRVWAEKQPPQPRTSCDFQAFVLLDVGAVCLEVSELLEEGPFFRDAHVKQAVTRVGQTTD